MQGISKALSIPVSTVLKPPLNPDKKLSDVLFDEKPHSLKQFNHLTLEQSCPFCSLIKRPADCKIKFLPELPGSVVLLINLSTQLIRS